MLSSSYIFKILVAVMAFGPFIAIAAQSQSAGDGCHMECPKMNQKSQSKQNCRWILRTDGKPARLCEQAKCKKVCPKENQEASATSNDEQTRVEQHIEGSTDSQPASSGTQAMGIMQQRYGGKLKQAPVPGVPGGRLTPGIVNHPVSSGVASGARRIAPTLAPGSYDDNDDSPPAVSRFLDISPDE